MAECLEKPSKHLAALYNKSFVILGGNSFSLFFVCSESVWVTSELIQPGVRAPLTVALLKLHGSILNMRILGGDSNLFSKHSTWKHFVY